MKKKIFKPLGLAMSHNSFVAFSGIITALLIINYFSEELQGLYYTIISFTALKVFLDAGFSNVIISFVSQNKNKIEIGDKVVFKEDGFKNLSNIFNYSRKRFLLVSCFGFIILHLLAWVFFKDYISYESVIYWFFLSLFFSLNIVLIPYLCVIEGLDYLSSLFSFRIRYSIINSISSWLVIFFEGGVLCLLVLNFTMLIQNFLYITKHNYIFKELHKGKIDNEYIRPIVRPFGLKIGVSFLTGYFLNNGIVPIIFKFISPSLAGLYGLSWSLFSIISTLPKQFIIVIRPKLGLLFKEKSYKQFWNLFINNFFKSISLYLFLALSVLALHFLFDHTLIVKRLLNQNNFILMSILFLVLNVIGNFTHFFRPQLKEPLYFLNVISTISVLIFIFYFIDNLSVEYLLLSIIITYLLFGITGLTHYTYKFHKTYINNS